MDTPDFTTAFAHLNRALQAAFDEGAGQLSPDLRADGLAALAEITGASGQGKAHAPADAVLGEWACGYGALDDAMTAAFCMGQGNANMDTGLWFQQSVERVLADTAGMDPSRGAWGRSIRA